MRVVFLGVSSGGGPSDKRQLSTIALECRGGAQQLIQTTASGNLFQTTVGTGSYHTFLILSCAQNHLDLDYLVNMLVVVSLVWVEF